MLGAGDPERARLMRAPSGGGDAPRFDILDGEREGRDDGREVQRDEREDRRVGLSHLCWDSDRKVQPALHLDA